jgi:hypothetical protein
MAKFLFFLFLFFTKSLIFFAQEKIATDRPDQTESTVLVPPHYFQAEFGFGKENLDKENYNLVHPTALFKYGLSKRFELRLETNYVSAYEHLIPQSKTITGFEPIRIGFRTALWEERKIVPKTSLLVHFGIPGLATKNFKANHIAPSLLLAMQNSLTEHIALSYNVGAEWDGFSSTPYWLYSVSSGYDLGKRWDAFFEIFGTAQRNELAQNSLDTGFGFYVSPNVKLDASAGIGITDAAVDYFFGIGFSFRIHCNKKVN